MILLASTAEKAEPWYMCPR